MSKDVNLRVQENSEEVSPFSALCGKASNGLCLIARSLLWSTLALILITWLKAWYDGELPELNPSLPSNHGPWRHYEVGRGMVWIFITLPFLAGCSALLAWMVKPTANTGVFAFLCIVITFIVAGTHFWLVD